MSTQKKTKSFFSILGLLLFVLCIVYPAFITVIAFCIFVCLHHFHAWYQLDRHPIGTFRPFIKQTIYNAMLLLITCFWLAFSIGSPYSLFGNFYSNSSFYSIGQKGFVYNTRLQLVSSDMGSAVWENEVGDLYMEEDHLIGSLFLKPVYSDHNNGNLFSIQNPVFEQPVNQSIAIEKTGANPLVLASLTIEKRWNDTYRYTVNNGVDSDVLSRTSCIIRGIRLTDLIAESDLLQLSDEALYVLENAWLLRRSFNPAKGSSTSDLLFYPGENFLEARNIRLLIDGQPVTNKTMIPLINYPLQTGERFFVGIAGTYRSLIYRYQQIDNRNQLIVHFGPRYHFKDGNRGEQFNFLLTNSEDELLQSNLRDAFYLGALSNVNSNYYYSGTMSYTIESAFRPLHIRWNDSRNSDNTVIESVERSKRFELTTNDPGVSWLFEVENMRKTNGLEINTVLGIILITGCLLLLILSFPLVRKKKVDSMQRSENIRLFESPLFYIILCLITIRFILQWRAGVFAPLSGISENHYVILRQNVYGALSTISLLQRYQISAFILLITLVVYFFSLKINIPALLTKWLKQMKIPRREVNNEGKPVIPVLFIALALLQVIVTTFAFLFRKPLTIIIIPVSVFLFTAVLLKFYYSSPQLERENQLNRCKGLLQIQWLFVMVALINDMGFAFIFLLASLTFFVICNVSKWLDRLEKAFQKNKRKTSISLVLTLLTVPLFLFLFWNLASNIKHLSVSVIVEFVLLLYPVCLFAVFSILLIRDGKISDDKRRSRKMYIFALVLTVAPTALFIWKTDVFGDRLRNTHFRSVLIKEKVSDIVEDIDNSRDATGFFNAAHNQWLINTYHEQSPFFSTLNVKPHTGIGSDYVTQTNDLICIRYVIAEHGRLTGYLLCILLLMPLVARIIFSFDKRQHLPYYERTDHQLNSFMNIDLFVFVLVFMLAFIVWLSATNRFIFIGQDFPLIVFNSGASLTYILLFFFIALLLKSPDQKYFYSISDVRKHSPKWRRLTFIGAFVVAIYIFMGVVRMFNPNKSDATDMGMSNFVKKTKTSLDDLNLYFVDFQFDNRIMNLDTLVLRFDRYLQNKEDPEEFIPPFIGHEYQKFLLVKNKTKSNQLIYLSRRSDRYYFTMNERFYQLESPFDNKKFWEGDLTDKSGRLLAKYMYVNGKHRHVYPEKEDLIWAYNLTEYIRTNVVKKSDKKLQVTLDLNLQDSIATLLNRKFDGLNTERFNKREERVFNAQIDRFLNLSLNNKLKRNHSGLQLVITDNNFQITSSQHRKVAEINRRLRINRARLWNYYQNNNNAMLNHVINTLTEKVLYYDAFINLVALDGNGNVRIMLDHGANRKFNPNNLSANYNYINEITILGNQETVRNRFGDRSLLINSNPGNGSTTKPIIYTAMTSQYQLPGGWENLGVWNQAVDGTLIENKPYNNTNYQFVNYYAGRNFGQPYKLKNTSPYPNEGNYFSPISYLAKSSNMYNSVMLFLGSYTTDELDTYLNAPQKEVDKYSTFPSMRIEGKTRYFDADLWPGNGHFDNQQSILAIGLRGNFGFITNRTDEGKAGKLWIPDADFMGKKTRNTGLDWVLPEPSSFIQQSRSTGFRDAIANPSLGNYPIKVSPIGMAVACARTLLLNKAYEPYFFEQTKSNYKKFETWNWNRYSDFHRKTIIRAMNRIFIDGTLNEVGGPIVRNNQTAQIRNNEGRSFFIYGKTGTASDMDDSNFGVDHLTIFLISDKDLSAEDPENAKFYSIYLNVSFGSELASIRAEVLQAIVNSNTFKEYMK